MRTDILLVVLYFFISLFSNTMSISNNFSQIKKLDKANVLGSIELLSKQVEQAWRETKKLKIPADYRKVKNAVINGMGGSALGGQIIKSLYSDEIGLPFEVINSCTVPGYVGRDTLYLISSFSGHTEEPIGTYEEARKRGAKILAITAGGRLSQMMQEYDIPGYHFRAVHNPCNQPRMAAGYSVVGQLGLLKGCGIINVSDREIKKVQGCLSNLNRTFGVSSKNRNEAKILAGKLKNRMAVLVASEILAGNVHTFANQINENAKNFSCWFLIPELNHHLMEGLSNPSSNKAELIFVFINSSLYSPRVQLRHKITQEVVKKNNIEYIEYQVKARDKLSQSFEVLSFGSYVSFYLAMLNNIDPSGVPWVDYFKRRLSGAS